jgi:hypothetical protein
LKVVDLSTESERSRSILRVIAYVSLVIVILILIYAFLDASSSTPGGVGADLVNVEVPPPSISPIFLKPITIFYVAAALLLYSSLELNKERIGRISLAKKTGIKTLGFITAVICVFEVGYNFVYWAGQIAAESIEGSLKPDLISNPFPSLIYPINVVFASRLFVFFTIAGIYVFYYMSRLDAAKAAPQVK